MCSEERNSQSFMKRKANKRSHYSYEELRVITEEALSLTQAPPDEEFFIMLQNLFYSHITLTRRNSTNFSVYFPKNFLLTTLSNINPSKN